MAAILSGGRWVNVWRGRPVTSCLSASVSYMHETMGFLASTRHLTVHRLIMQHAKPTGPVFTKPQDVLPCLVKYRSHEIWVSVGWSLWNLTGVSAVLAESPVKCQIDTIILRPNLTASRLSEISTDILSQWTSNLRLWLPLVCFSTGRSADMAARHSVFKSIVCKFTHFIPMSAWTLKPLNDGFVAKICC